MHGKFGQGSQAERTGAMTRIERHFSALWPGVEVILTPSARAGLALVLGSLPLGRGKVVHVPRWSSHCVWNVVSRFGDPGVGWDPRPDASLVVHKFGYTAGLSRPWGGLVLEDSCDSIFLEGGGLFPNGGLAEFISLPKTMGTVAGGLILTRDPHLAQEWRTATREFSELNQNQAILRRRYAEGEIPANLWDAQEFCNFSMDSALLANIEANLPAWEANGALIRARLQQLQDARPSLWTGPFIPDPLRLPSVFPIRPLTPGATGLPIRNLDSSRTIDAPCFETWHILPLHAGIPAEEFEGALAQLNFPPSKETNG